MNVNLQTCDSRFKSETLTMYQSYCSIKIPLPEIHLPCVSLNFM